MCACVCVCVCVHVRVRVCACACACESMNECGSEKIRVERITEFRVIEGFLSVAIIYALSDVETIWQN